MATMNARMLNRMPAAIESTELEQQVNGKAAFLQADHRQQAVPAVGEVEIFESHDRHQKIFGQRLDTAIASTNTTNKHTSRITPTITRPMCSFRLVIHPAANARPSGKPMRTANDNHVEISSTICHRKYRPPARRHLSPAFADRTFAPQHRVEQDEAEHAVDVKEDEREHDEGKDSEQDQSEELPDVLRNVRGNMPGVER